MCYWQGIFANSNHPKADSWVQYRSSTSSALGNSLLQSQSVTARAFSGGRDVGCVQGITELVECVRTDDEWLHQVQNEIREGALTETSHSFLHGKPTRVPGSWVDGRCACDRLKCMALAQRAAKASTEEAAAAIIGQECEVCKAERASRCRVLSGPDDPRLLEPKFLKAPAIFPNNDIKYHVNKLRAQIFAARGSEACTWAPARGRPGTAALQDKPDIAAEKLAWLQRHDRDCADMYGMLLLIRNMPVALLDHIDRNPEVQLLKGRVGYVEGWATHGEENSQFKDGVRILSKPPTVVFVRFQKCVHDGGEPRWDGSRLADRRSGAWSLSDQAEEDNMVHRPEAEVSKVGCAA